MSTSIIPDIPIRAMCCIICTQPAQAKMTTDQGRNVFGACIRHIRFARRVMTTPTR